jgi:branched-chain amino acid transport system permease protein
MSLLIYGLLIGLVYGLWAVSFSIIYRPVRIFHVLHAAVFTVAAYTCWLVATTTGMLLLGVIAGLVTAIVVGVASELLVYRPLIRWNVRPGILFVASLAAYIIVENMIQLWWRADTRSVELPLFLESRLRIAGVGLSTLELAEGLVALALWLLTLALLRMSLLGKAIRAVATAPDMAELAGIRVGRIRITAFVYGSFLIGVAGIMFLMKVGIEPISGLPVWITAVIASLISRAHPFWCFVVALSIGICESVMLLWVPATWQPVIPVLALFGYLLFLSVQRTVSAAIARSKAEQAIKHA